WSDMVTDGTAWISTLATCACAIADAKQTRAMQILMSRLLGLDERVLHSLRHQHVRHPDRHHDERAADLPRRAVPARGGHRPDLVAKDRVEQDEAEVQHRVPDEDLGKTPVLAEEQDEQPDVEREEREVENDLADEKRPPQDVIARRPGRGQHGPDAGLK